MHGTETEVYARIVGYYRSVRNWNKGKKDEYNQRKMFTAENISSTVSSEMRKDAIVAVIVATICMLIYMTV